MMMPSRTVAGSKDQLLNLNVAGPGAAGKREIRDGPGDRVLKAERNQGARQCYAQPYCKDRLLTISCSFPICLYSGRGGSLVRLMFCHFTSATRYLGCPYPANCPYAAAPFAARRSTLMQEIS